MTMSGFSHTPMLNVLKKNEIHVTSFSIEIRNRWTYMSWPEYLSWHEIFVEIYFNALNNNNLKLFIILYKNKIQLDMIYSNKNYLIYHYIDTELKSNFIGYRFMKIEYPKFYW